MRNLFNRVFGNLTDNSWFLVLEVFWASISGSALSFVAAYAIRLGASNSAVSLLSSVPALIAAVFLLPVWGLLPYPAPPTRLVVVLLLPSRPRDPRPLTLS